MINSRELAEHLDAYVRGGMTAEAFEDWFDRESWNVHQQGSQRLTDAVFRVESLLSAYDDDRLSDDGLLKALEELANDIRPLAFDPKIEVVGWSDSDHVAMAKVRFSGEPLHELGSLGPSEFVRPTTTFARVIPGSDEPAQREWECVLAAHPRSEVPANRLLRFRHSA
jgi:hypothetical protein